MTITTPGAMTRNQLIDELVNGKLTTMYEDATAVHVTRDNMQELQRIVMEQRAKIERYEQLLQSTQLHVVELEEELKAANQSLWYAVHGGEES